LKSEGVKEGGLEEKKKPRKGRKMKGDKIPEKGEKEDGRGEGS